LTSSNHVAIFSTYKT